MESMNASDAAESGLQKVVAPAGPTWSELGLDTRVRRALTRLKWGKPTPVQAQGIALSLAGKDVLARAPTGSGKTAAFVLPMVNKVLLSKEAGGGGGVVGLVLVPTGELCKQVAQVFKEVTRYCASSVKALAISADASIETQRAQLADGPDVLIATPGRLALLLDSGSVKLSESVQSVAIDEADLLLSFGYEKDTRRVAEALPSICQVFLASATLSDDVEELNKLLMHNPERVDISDDVHGTDARLTQFYVACQEDDKFLLTYALLKLKVLPGKALIFVNDADKCFRLKLFLEKFSISSAALNPNLPQNTRYNVMQQFNRGFFDFLIATDESIDTERARRKLAEKEQERQKEEEEDGGEDDEEHVSMGGDQGRDALEADAAAAEALDGGGEASAAAEPAKKKKRKRADSEFNSARGLDFSDVGAVLNFDFPKSLTAYKHRIGRTARAGAAGVAVSLVAPAEADGLTDLEEAQKAATGSADASIQPLPFRLEQISQFRYRVNDVLRSVTSASVRDAQLKEVKRELLNSKKLQAHFEDNPNDLLALRHDEFSRSSTVQPHLKTVPKYLLPKEMLTDKTGVDAARSELLRHKSSAARRGGMSKRRRGNGKGKHKDPLRSFKGGTTRKGGGQNRGKQGKRRN